MIQITSVENEFDKPGSGSLTKVEAESPGDIVNRRALRLNQAANGYKEEIFLEDGMGRRVNAKSLLGILSLGINKNKKFNICVSENTPQTDEIIKRLLGVLDGGAAETETDFERSLGLDSE
jgi:phosphotransferase system HPr (HPr) family protein